MGKSKYKKQIAKQFKHNKAEQRHNSKPKSQHQDSIRFTNSPERQQTIGIALDQFEMQLIKLEQFMKQNKQIIRNTVNQSGHPIMKEYMTFVQNLDIMEEQIRDYKEYIHNAVEFNALYFSIFAD